MTTEDKAVLAAINAVQLALSKEGIGKGRTNSQQGYSFRGIDDMYNTLAPLLAKNGLVCLPTYSEREVVERTSAKGTALFYVTVRGEFSFVGLDGSSVRVTTYGEAMDSGDKATNKAMSAALKYAFMQTFTIPTEGDNDSENQTHEVTAAPPRGSAADVKKDAFEAFDLAAQERIRKAAADLTALVQEGRPAEAYGLWRNARYEIEEAAAVQHCMDSKTRSALKAAAEQWKKEHGSEK